MTSLRCTLHSTIDNTQCFLHNRHVGSCDFTYDDEEANDAAPVALSATTTDIIARAVDPNAPRDPDKPMSDLQHRFDLVDAPAMFEMTGVLYVGAKKYGEDNWRQISVEDHLNHLIAHAYAYLSGNRDDSHLANIMCRAMFAQGKAARPDFMGRASQ